MNRACTEENTRALQKQYLRSWGKLRRDFSYCSPQSNQYLETESHQLKPQKGHVLEKETMSHDYDFSLRLKAKQKQIQSNVTYNQTYTSLR